ncbi:MAG: PSD1 and planctomycete cytochrome C domain-containing protein [Bryobacteraceae bacterium]
MKRSLLGLLCFSFTFTLLAEPPAATQEQKDFFENRIRPLLAQNCFACHTNSQMGGLRLDSRDGLLKGGKLGAVVVPGAPEKSLLITAVRQNTDLKMPMGGHLTDAQIGDLATWIKDGAVFPEAPQSSQSAGYVIRPDQRKFWSFQPLAKPEPPKVKDAAWSKNPIDRFIFAKLEQEGMKPAPLADKRALLRRVTYVLTGLMPTYEEVKAFEADKSPDAYEKVVDHLMASQHFGELWARHWLDVTRYAEDDYRIASKNLHEERYKFAYTYRDWVINALNNDMPYDTFVKAQLAGDLMDAKVRDKMIPGLGFNGIGIWAMNDNPAPIDRASEWNDKVDTTSKALLGLTVGCARCHDHKYDPIPQKDYYRLAGVFASTNYHAYPLVSKDVVDEYEKQKKELDTREKALKTFEDQASDLEAQALFAQTEDYMVAAWRVGSEQHATVASIADKYRLDPELLERWVAFLKKKPSNYTFLVPWQKMVAAGGDLDQAQTLAHQFYQKAQEIDREQAKIKAENEDMLAKIKDPHEQFDPLPNGIKRKLITHQIALKGMDREPSYLWTDLFDKDLSDAPLNDNADGEKKPGLFKFTGWELQRRLGPDFSNHIDKLTKDNEAFKKAMPAPYPVAMGLADKKNPTDLRVFLRGDPYTFGAEAPRAFLAIFSQGEPKPFAEGSGRLELADDIVKEPISMRVIVNRIWSWNMGSGIVETPNNFGVAGDRPSDPALLEFLTSQFVDNGMHWKPLIKEIVMSRAFRLSSEENENNLAKDGANRYYWRANQRRLEAEGIWDGLLMASGKLDISKIGGPSQELDTKMTRRGMYGAVSRVFPNEFQSLFDYPIPTLSAAERYTTNTPLQRLYFLNNPFVHEQADALAERVKSAGSDEAEVQKAFEIVYQREPSPQELSASVALLHQPGTPPQEERAEVSFKTVALNAKPAGASSLDVAPGPDSKAKTKKPEEETPLQALCWALLSSNEFLFLN